MPFGVESNHGAGMYHDAAWVPVGETEDGDNTSDMIYRSGLSSAHGLSRWLSLAPITQIPQAERASTR
jgi:hypothetical protein